MDSDANHWIIVMMMIRIFRVEQSERGIPEPRSGKRIFYFFIGIRFILRS